MYKSSSGEKKFSFTRLMTNAVPNLAMAPVSHDLAPQEEDAVFDHQIGEPVPMRLSEVAFLFGGITASEKVSISIYKALIKNEVLSETEAKVDTKLIGAKFNSQLSMIPAHAQKKLINLLFFWEEEIMRWKVLQGEKEELETVTKEEQEAGGNVGSYEIRLKELEGLLKLKPSLRGERARDAENLPGYQPPPPPAASRS